MWCATAQWWWHPGESPNLRRTRIVYRGPRLEAAASRVCLAHERVHLGQKRFRMPGSYRAKVTGTPGNTTVCTGCIFLWLHRIIHQKIPESSKRTVVLHWGNILPSGDIWQCLETTFHSYGGATGSQGAQQHPTIHKGAPTTKHCLATDINGIEVEGSPERLMRRIPGWSTKSKVRHEVPGIPSPQSWEFPSSTLPSQIQGLSFTAEVQRGKPGSKASIKC